MITGNFIKPEWIEKGKEQPTAGHQQLPNVQPAECHYQQPLQQINQGYTTPPIINYITINPTIEYRVTETTNNSPLSDLMGPLGILSKLFKN